MNLSSRAVPVDTMFDRNWHHMCFYWTSLRSGIKGEFFPILYRQIKVVKIFIIFIILKVVVIDSRVLSFFTFSNDPGGHSTFFQVGVCGPDFRSVGLANWHLPLKRGLVSGKFPNLGACELKFPNLGACELKFGWKLRLLRLKFQNFLKRGSCELTLLLEMGPLRAAGEAWKGGLQGRTSPYPLSRSVPPPG